MPWRILSSHGEPGHRDGHRRARGAVPRAPRERQPRIVIQYPAPAVDGGRYPAKRCVGDARRGRGRRSSATATSCCARSSATAAPATRRWREAEMRADRRPPRRRPLGGRLRGRRASAAGEYTVEAWTDSFGTWRDELRRKLAAGQHELAGELVGGRRCCSAPRRARAQRRRPRADRARAATLDDAASPSPPSTTSRSGPSCSRPSSAPRSATAASRSSAPLAIEVDRVAGAVRRLVRAVPALVGRLRGRRAQLPRVRRARRSTCSTCRRSTRSATPTARAATTRSSPGRSDPGSPVGDRRRDRRPRRGPPGARDDRGLRRASSHAAREHGIDIALDFAIQCSADHPWLNEHPEWFHRRPDGTLKYAENPPKRYQDIYNVNWESRGLARAVGRAAATSSSTGSTAASRSSASTTRTPSRSRSGRG